MSDASLARLAARGDERAFGEIYARHHQGLYRYCRSILGSDADAQDALQNVMASALAGLVGETREIALKPWLYRVAHNESISLVRRRRGDAGLDSVLELAGADDADPETRERLRQLFHDLAALPERQRSALVMRELSGLDYDEIAAACDITVAAATQAVYDARRGLHEFAEGREMQCDEVRRTLSANDRRSLRSRRIKAHLVVCPGCRAFGASIEDRTRDLAMLAPALPAATSAVLLHGVVGSSASGSGAGGGATGVAAAAKAAGSSLLVKGAVATALVGAGGAVVATEHHSTGQPPAPPPTTHTAAPKATPQPTSAAPQSGPAHKTTARHHHRPTATTHTRATTHDSAQTPTVDHPTHATPTKPPAAPTTQAPAAAPPTTGTGNTSAPTDSAPPSTPAAPDPTPATPTTTTAPGNSGNAPGQDPNGPGNSENAPGHSDSGPGNSPNAPGHDTAGAGNSENAPGHTGTTPPGNSGTTAPGNSGNAPGHNR